MTSVVSRFEVSSDLQGHKVPGGKTVRLLLGSSVTKNNSWCSASQSEKEEEWATNFKVSNNWSFLDSSCDSIDV